MVTPGGSGGLVRGVGCSSNLICGGCYGSGVPGFDIKGGRVRVGTGKGAVANSKFVTFRLADYCMITIQRK